MEQRVEYLDWLRAVAVLFVMVGHASPSTAPGGAIGVSVFFVISGYLICSILLRDGMLTIPNVVRFWVRRAARIYPMYVAQILIVWLWLYRDDADKFLLQMPGLLTFTSDFGVWFGYSVGVLWSLAVEFWFYITFPALLFIARRTGYPVTFFLILMVVSIAARLNHTESLTLAYYHQFLIGVIIALLVDNRKVPEFLASHIAFNSALAVLAICVAVPITARNFGGYFQGTYAALATGVLICHWLQRPPRASLPIMQGIGAISYSAYLLHPIVIDYIWKTKQHLPSHIPTFVAISLSASLVTCFAIERPFIALAHKFIGFKKFSVAPASQTETFS
ncbi:acyltransferase [Bradyrhizobium sp. Gha]|uniref:acyltransferase family protein n=1 Tax=Bradyrhizobium sp. Gha TaxID=1855318 RepID=UPI0008E13CD0|nr:acyltransferase [Bradyrhizobium sp. Gha]SFI48945.1 Peptidoglycan/LPS O-acetylase OafA/YrhL, contains acyltransferase and SGNH-hydrolase domains [Bradyrhizobium sp. Gha]